MLGYVYDLDGRLLLLCDSHGEEGLKIVVHEPSDEEFEVLFVGEARVEDGVPVMVYYPDPLQGSV